MAQESTPEEGADIRRKAMIRLGIAAAVTLLALAALWWLDQSGKPEPKPKAAAPAPIVSAPALPPPPPAEPPEEEPAPDAAAEPPAEAAPPPPPPAAPEAGLPAPRKPAATAGAAAPRRPAAPAVTPPASPPPPADAGYVVQLGVFTNPANAQELVERLKKQGIRAYTETRVHVGPFKDKAEAEKAQAELKRLGVSGLVGTTK